MEQIEVGFQVFTREGDEEVGAVRGPADDGTGVLVYIENAGDFVVPLTAIQSVHDGKVIIDPARLDDDVQHAIAHAHDQEEPGL